MTEAEALELATVTAERNVAHRQLRHIARVLLVFYAAPLTVSALQPILDLAMELNPELQDHARRI